MTILTFSQLLKDKGLQEKHWGCTIERNEAIVIFYDGDHIKGTRGWPKMCAGGNPYERADMLRTMKDRGNEVFIQLDKDTYLFMLKPSKLAIRVLEWWHNGGKSKLELNSWECWNKECKMGLAFRGGAGYSYVLNVYSKY